MNDEIGCSIMCRACMKVDGVLLSMYDDCTIRKKNFPDKLADLASIQIDRYDGLPSVLCTKCAYRTDAFHDFKLQVQETEKKLRKMFECPIVRSKVPEPERLSDEFAVGDFPIETPLEIRTEERVEASIKREFQNNETEQILPDDLCENPSIVDSRNFVESESREDRQTVDLFKNETILILDGHDERARNNNYEIYSLPNDIKDILHSENIDYEFFSITEENKAGVDPAFYEYPNDTRETSEETFSVESSDEKIPADLENPGKASETRETPKKTNSVENSQKEEASESDYSVDFDKNLLGSLNDTITRIKEIKNEAQKTIFQCSLCMENYEELTGVLSHTVETHVPKTGPFFCVVCEKDCPSHRELREHVKTHSGKYPYTCFVCNKAYSMKRYLKRHMSCHTDLPRHRCPKCGQRFTVKNDLENHLVTHSEAGPPFACDQCPRFFNHKGNYKRHLIRHLDPRKIHLPKYPCEICGKRFLNNRTLQTHIRVHTGEKPFECDICKRSFSQRGNLLNHQRIHYNPRSYSCEVCGKRFNQRATLRDHGLLHTGEKPYVCNVCGLAFTFGAALRRHMWSHSTDKPFGCEICNARFVGKYDIKRHMKIHTDRPKFEKTRIGRTKVRQKRTPINHSEIAFPGNEIRDDRNSGEQGAKIFIQEVLLVEDSNDIGRRDQGAEKENVDVLLNLIEYG